MASINRRTVLCMLAAAATPAVARATPIEPEFFMDMVGKGALPPVKDRLPSVPRVINLAEKGRLPGKHGGNVRMLIGRQKDIRLMTINGYARLVGFDEQLNLQPDILESYEQVDGRIFTFRLRAGHRWSDGSPFTSEDFRYTWEDVLTNKKLRRRGLPREFLSDGRPPVFEVIDEQTVRYTWDTPHPGFLQSLASAQALTLAMPSAYMKQFHVDYVGEEKVAEAIEKYRVETWPDLHTKLSRSYRPENPDLPTLDPWRNTTLPPAQQYIFERNPYFHRVDENGRQLPYVDRFLLNVSSSDIISAKTGAGETDLQITHLDFSDYTFLKSAEDIHPVDVNLWKRVQGSRIALFPNLNCADPVWREFLRHRDVRCALSIAINRREINMVSFFGLAKESADTVLQESPLYKPNYALAWAQFDPDEANALLDRAGYSKRNDAGVRLLPDGRPIDIVIETAGESTLETDVLELVTDHWRAIGLAPFIRVSQRDIFRSRAIAGETTMAVWVGLDNGVPTADMTPAGLAPTADDQMQWPLWGMNHITQGKEGLPVDMPAAKRLLDLLHAWERSTESSEREVIWHEMLAIRAENVFSIGIVNAALQPIVHSSRLRNVPAEGLYGFAPTCYFGVYMPDTFWFDESA
ncbi:ABC transporter substrate-binding protein [uncultured Hoeflea sp.]|uniref:ABC transporter substrate-binding protein n=1 Tax=uncultured Hoeflea sp. TaxID=538666 RepID=UPI00261D17BC|nr:ABC transporter substrate-binding protein [uncultured Hoeflea sp.]